jgi:hypothetical protein
MTKEAEIYEAISAVAGIAEDGTLDGVPVYFSVKEMRQRVGSSVWKAEPSGRFQINVDLPGQSRDRIFRTKLKDGSFDLEGVIDALKTSVRIRNAEIKREATRNANKDAAAAIRNDPALKLNKTYVSGYAASANSFVAPSTVEGLINVQINFGAVDPETAVKILAFAKSMGA